MLQQIISTTWKDMKILFKDIGGIATLFFMPLMFILVMSTALQGLFDADSDSQPEFLPVVNLDDGDFAAEIITALNEIEGIEVEGEWEGEALSLENAENIVTSGERQLVIYFPPDFSQSIENRKHDPDTVAAIEMITDPALSLAYFAPMQGMVLGTAERVVETQIFKDSVQENMQSIFDVLPKEVRSDFEDISIDLEGDSVVEVKQVSPAGMNIEVEPDTYQQNVPGYATMGVFFIVGTMASSILAEKKEGTFRRLLVAPLSKGALLGGKILTYYLVNLIQIAIMFGTAHLLFDMIFGDLPALVVVSLSLAAAATGLGVLIAALGKTDTQITGLTSLLTLTMSALGGCLMPTFIMPDFLQKISRIIPHAWAMQGFQDVLVRGMGVEGILLESSILLTFAAVFFLIGVWRFRFD